MMDGKKHVKSFDNYDPVVGMNPTAFGVGYFSARLKEGGVIILPLVMNGVSSS